MNCPLCGKKTYIMSSTEQGGLLRRRRICRVCDYIFLTYERRVVACDDCKHKDRDKNTDFCNNPDSRRYGSAVGRMSGCDCGEEK